jgi:hypothetical protein
MTPPCHVTLKVLQPQHICAWLTCSSPHTLLFQLCLHRIPRATTSCLPLGAFGDTVLSLWDASLLLDESFKIQEKKCHLLMKVFSQFLKCNSFFAFTQVIYFMLQRVVHLFISQHSLPENKNAILFLSVLPSCITQQSAWHLFGAWYLENFKLIEPRRWTQETALKRTDT